MNETTKVALAIAVLAFAVSGRKVPLEEEARSLHGQEFVNAVYAIESRYKLPKGSLFSIFQAESGMNPAARNRSSGAVGLIQFMPSTLANNAAYGGLSPAQVQAMSALQQLNLVDAFYRSWYNRGKRPRSPEEVYLLTFYPAAVGRPNNFVLGSEVSTQRAFAVGQANRGFDVDNDGVISIANFKQYLRTASRLRGTIFQR